VIVFGEMHLRRIVSMYASSYGQKIETVEKTVSRPIPA
jgi:hypothetical protein